MQNRNINRDEVARRVSVYAKQRRTVLVKIAGSGTIDGLEEKQRDEQKIFFKHVDEAERRELNGRAYRRGDVDTGHQWCNQEGPVRVTDLVADLAEAGLRYCGGHWHQREGKSVVNTLEFSIDSSRWVEMPEAVKKALALRFQWCTTWCNLKFESDEANSKQCRLDTVNLHGGHTSAKPAKALRISGSTYVLEAPVTEEVTV